MGPKSWAFFFLSGNSKLAVSPVFFFLPLCQCPLVHPMLATCKGMCPTHITLQMEVGTSHLGSELLHSLAASWNSGGSISPGNHFLLFLISNLDLLAWT